MKAQPIPPRNTAWYRALDLTERLSTLRAAPELPTLTAAEREAAGVRLQTWKEQPPLARDGRFAERLRADGITEAELLHLLGEPAEAVRDRHPGVPEWVTRLDAALQPPWPSPPELTPDPEGAGRDEARLLGVVRPLTRQAARRLEEGIAALAGRHEHLPFDPRTAAGLLLAHLPGHVVGKLTRTVALEVNVARLQGRLTGDDPRARFDDFLRLLHQGGGLDALLGEYPVMARQLVGAVDNWLEGGLEFLARLAADWGGLRAAFSPCQDPGPLAALVGGAGDFHQGGRCVQLLTFRSGLRLVYKPKPLAVDAHFQELLAWLNGRGDFPPFRALRVLDRGPYGWTEYARPERCRTAAEVARFYRRQGGYLALLYALEATDFHSENVIAAGEHPVLVDLEALFHPRLGAEASGGPAERALAESVLRVGLLPERVGASDRVAGVDVSALGGRAGQLSPRPVARWSGFATDEMRVVRRHVALEGSDNRPTLDGVPADAAAHLGELTAGFAEVYRVLLAHRAELAGGPLRRFLGDEVRVVVRSTRTYNTVLRTSLHPDLLRDALERDRFLDWLWLPVGDQPHLARLIALERADLLRGDVPKFTTRVGSRDLFGSRGERLPDFFGPGEAADAPHRLGRLSPQDLERQLGFIRAAFATLPLGKARDTWKGSRLAPAAAPATPAALVAAARRVGGRLGELALRDGDAVGWVGLDIAGDVEWQLRPAGFDLYSGAAGIGLFLAYLGAATGEAAYTDLARAALRAVRRQLAATARLNDGPSVGAFNGLGSPIYLYTHLAALWGEPALLDEAEELVGWLAGRVGADAVFDLTGGSAGAIAALLGLYRLRPSPATLAAAVRCGDHLVRGARPAARGVGWESPLPSAAPLTGMAHGAAGIGMSLLRLARATGDRRFRDTGLAALEYERSVFCERRQNWPTLRTAPPAEGGCGCEDGGSDYLTTWCYGAPGIGLGRLACLPDADGPAVRREVAAAVGTTVREGFGLNHSLCHGDLGNLDLLLTAVRVLGPAGPHAELTRFTAAVLDSVRREGWCTGIPQGAESPELMTGLGGIGYGLLRLADPERVPSVLTLDPPPPPKHLKLSDGGGG
jgi:type 2 lantibiotic biosynthesis protein LanM